MMTAKITISLLRLPMIMLCGMLSSSTLHHAEPGDVNDDGYVNKTDAELLRDYLLAKETQIDAEAADINADGTLNAKDLTLLKRRLLL